MELAPYRFDLGGIHRPHLRAVVLDAHPPEDPRVLHQEPAEATTGVAFEERIHVEGDTGQVIQSTVSIHLLLPELYGNGTGLPISQTSLIMRYMRLGELFSKHETKVAIAS